MRVSCKYSQCMLILVFRVILKGVDCITDHAKFRVVCLDTDVLHTALVALHNARFNLLPDPIVNRQVDRRSPLFFLRNYTNNRGF